MPAERIKLDPETPDGDAIQRVASAMNDGALVAFPTETVYGVGGTAVKQDVVKRMRDLKGADANQSLTVHVASQTWAQRFLPPLEGAGLHLTRKAWPGPVTLVFPVDDPGQTRMGKSLDGDCYQAVYGSGYVGIRYPQDAIALDLLTRAVVPVVASSAGIKGQQPPVAGDQISDDLADRVDFILDAGPTRYRKASTVVKLNGKNFELVRAGVFDERIVRRLATVHILFVCTGNTCRSPIAEGLCRKMLAERIGCELNELEAFGYVVESAGTMAWPGHPASPESVEVLKTRGVDATNGRSQAVGIDLLHTADHVLTMTANHAEQVKAISQRDAKKVRTLAPNDIGDPIGGPLAQYESVAQEIEAALRVWLDEVKI